MQLCCGIRLELSEQIIPAKGSQEPLPNGSSADKAAFSKIMEAELLILCEQGLRCVWHVRCTCPGCTWPGCQLPPTLMNYLPLWAKIKAVSFFVIVPTFLPEALGCKRGDWISFLLSKYFDAKFHIMHHSPQAETKQVSAVSLLKDFFPLSSVDFRC